jgi:hypothetical protein
MGIVLGMTSYEADRDAQRDDATLSLSDYIQNASALESVDNDDGSTTIYLQVHRRERFSTLPRLERQSWLTRVLGRRTATAEDSDRLGEAANVRKIPRRRSDLI